MICCIRGNYFPQNPSALGAFDQLAGKAIAYLPAYFGEGSAMEALKVSGCLYSCSHKIKLLAWKPRDTGWMSDLFS